MEPSGTTGTPPRPDAIPAARQAPSDGGGLQAPPEKQRGPSQDSRPRGTRWRARRGQETAPPPWRVEGVPDDGKDQPGDRPGWSRILLVLLGLLLLNWLLASALTGLVRPSVPYTFFLTQVNANNIQTVTSTGDTIQGTFRHQVAYPPGSAQSRQVEQFTTQRPSYANDNLFGKLQANGVTVTANPPNQGTPLWEELLLWFGPALLLWAGFAYVMRRGGAAGLGGLGGSLGMGKSKAKRYDPDSAKRTTFADVAGIDEVKSEVSEIVDFLRDPASTPGWARRSRTACCCPASPAPARRCWPGRSRARRRSRSSRSRPRSSSR